MMRLALRALLLSLLVSASGLMSSAARSAQAPDAADLEQAARLLAFQSRFNEALRVYCGKQFPDAKSQFDILVMSWVDANQLELNGLQAYLPTVNRKDFDARITSALTQTRVQLEAADTPQKHTANCETFATQLMGAPPLTKTAPNASRFLRGYLEEHPLPALELQKSAARTVCLKKGMNQQLDVDALQPRCACSTQRIFELLTPQELAEVDKVVKAFGDIESLPAVQRIAPQLAECQKK